MPKQPASLVYDVIFKSHGEVQSHVMIMDYDEEVLKLFSDGTIDRITKKVREFLPMPYKLDERLKILRLNRHGGVTNKIKNKLFS